MLPSSISAAPAKALPPLKMQTFQCEEPKCDPAIVKSRKFSWLSWANVFSCFLGISLLLSFTSLMISLFGIVTLHLDFNRYPCQAQGCPGLNLSKIESFRGCAIVEFTFSTIFIIWTLRQLEQSKRIPGAERQLDSAAIKVFKAFGFFTVFALSITYIWGINVVKLGPVDRYLVTLREESSSTVLEDFANNLYWFTGFYHGSDSVTVLFNLMSQTIVGVSTGISWFRGRHVEERHYPCRERTVEDDGHFDDTNSLARGSGIGSRPPSSIFTLVDGAHELIHVKGVCAREFV